MQRLPTCPSCCKNFSFKEFRPVGPHIPLLLKCGHSFCESCLAKRATGCTELECPVCQMMMPLEPPGADGVNNLLPDVYILGILSYNRRIALQSDPQRIPGGDVLRFAGIDSLNANTPQAIPLDSVEQNDPPPKPENPSLCEECDEELPTCQCKTCDILVCGNCFKKIHSISKLLSKHQQVPIVDKSSKESSELCALHNDKLLEFYDNDTDKAICSHCVISPECKGHEIVAAHVKAESIKENTLNTIKDAEKTLDYLELSRKMLITALPEASLEIGQLFEDVDRHFVALHSRLLSRQLALLQDISNQLHQHSDIASTLHDTTLKARQLSQKLQECQALIGNDVLLISKGKKLETDLRVSGNGIPCCAVRSDAHLPLLRFVPPESTEDNQFQIGSFEISDQQRFVLKSVADTPKEALDLLSKQVIPSQSLDCLRLEQNEILKHSATNFTSNISKEAKFVILLAQSFEMVYVTHVASPTDFYIQRCADKDRLQMTMNNLNKYCRQSNSRSDLVYTASEGDVVCAQFISDNHWYRARVISDKPPHQPTLHPTLDNGHCVEVVYIDYGNTEWLPIARLRKLQPCFLEVPELAVPCSLVDVVPPGKQESWPLISVKAFNNLVGEKPMLMNIRGRSSGKLFVDLRKPDDDVHGEGDERPISVRDALVFLDCAHFLSQQSMPGLTGVRRIFKDIDLPPVGSSIDVVVTLVEGIDHVIVQQIKSPVFEIQRKLVKLYTGKNKDSYRVAWPYKNLACAAKFSEDKSWYRALVTDVHDDETVDVTYVDFGNSERVSFSDLRVLPGPILALPKQAFELRLYNVAPFPDDATGEFIQEALQQFGAAVLSKPLSASIKAMDSNGVILADLFDQETHSTLSINSQMIKNKYATWLDESVYSSSNEASNVPDVVNGSQDPVSDVCYLPAEVPEGEAKVTGVHVSDKLDIFVHYSTDDGARLSKVVETLDSSEGLQKTSQKPLNTTGILIDSPCIAQYACDGMWYRTSISKIMENNQVELDFVDFGNKEVQDISTVRLCHPFLDIPKLCLKIKIAGLSLDALDGDTQKAVHEFLDFAIVNNEFTICITRRDGHALEAEATMKDGTSIKDAILGLDAMKNAKPLVAERQLSVRSEVELPLYQNVSKSFPLPDVRVRFDVLVTEVDLPNVVYLQRLPPADSEYFSDRSEETSVEAFEQIDTLSQFSAEINAPKYFTDESVLNRVNEGAVVAGKYTEDDTWYRAVVVAVTPGDDPSASVIYIDYGTKETVPLSRLRYLPNSAFDLPVQSAKCRIAGIQPPEKMAGEPFGNTAWPVKAMTGLFRSVANKRLIAEILDYGPPIVVNLYDRCSVADSETGETVDVLVGRQLANDGVVSFDIDADAAFDNWIIRSETATEDECQSIASSLVTESDDGSLVDSKRLLELPITPDCP